MFDHRKSALARIRNFNAEYLSFAQELARNSTAAAPTLGLPQEIADILTRVPLSRFQPLIGSNMLIARLRVTDPSIWKKVAEGSLDQNQLLHAFLTTVPAEFISGSLK